MTTCNYCHQFFDHLPFKCKFCGFLFCKNCHLPETHHCFALSKSNIFTRLDKRHRKKHWHGGTNQDSQSHNSSFCSSVLYDVKSWAHRRPDHSYIDRKEARNGLILVILLTLATMWAYSNIDKLNEIKIWILPLGSWGSFS